ncbi:hypothetical protein C0993_007507 [Termitomyces sp. T159_Od127]|nr:hypothetical protein C0993_007507 [Termitomyces sp. T159_Od127]
MQLSVVLSRPATDPRDSNPPQDDPHDRPVPGPLPGQPLGSPRPSPAITGHHHHQPPPLVASPAITAHHCPSPPQPPPPAAPPAITAVTATSAPAPPVTLACAETPITHHASQSCITADPTSARHIPLPFPPHRPAAACLCVPGRDLCATQHISTLPRMAPGSHPKPRRRDPPLEPQPEPRALPTA